MKPVVIAIFAHPDDEAFGPGGTLAVLSKTHNVYIITVTGGEAGKNSLDSAEKDLSEIRKSELLSSAKILGVKKVYFLGFKDGSLSNNLYHKIASKIERKLKVLKPDIVITFESGGVSGHIDHIATHFITTFVVKKLKKNPQLWYYFVPETHRALPSDYFIYFPPALEKSDADKIIDTTDVWDIKKKAMLAHRSQAHDANRLLKHIEILPKNEYFLFYRSG